MMDWRVAAIFILACALKVEEVTSSADILKKMTVEFQKVLKECQKEINFGDHIMADFINFWKEDYALVNREMGCAVMCMASKFDMINDVNMLHHTNAHSFAKTHGADDDTAQQIVDMIHSCEKEHDAIVDDCGKTLEVMKCFRTKIHNLKWAPDMETVLEEIMTEVKA